MYGHDRSESILSCPSIIKRNNHSIIGARTQPHGIPQADLGPDGTTEPIVIQISVFTLPLTKTLQYLPCNVTSQYMQVRHRWPIPYPPSDNSDQKLDCITQQPDLLSTSYPAVFILAGSGHRRFNIKKTYKSARLILKYAYKICFLVPRRLIVISQNSGRSLKGVGGNSVNAFDANFNHESHVIVLIY